jgi:Na+/proline symporter
LVTRQSWPCLTKKAANETVALMANAVMPGLVAGIHVLGSIMQGSSPAMTQNDSFSSC